MKKIIIYLTIIFTILSGSILWLTKTEVLKSQSAYALSENNLWYILMHVFMSMTFFLLSAYSKEKWLYFITAFGSFFTAFFNVIEFQWLHNISTALLFIFACTSIIVYTKKPLKKYNIILTTIASISFLSGLLGWLGFSGIFLAEIIVEICISIGVIIEINQKNE